MLIVYRISITIFVNEMCVYSPVYLLTVKQSTIILNVTVAYINMCSCYFNS